MCQINSFFQPLLLCSIPQDYNNSFDIPQCLCVYIWYLDDSWHIFSFFKSFQVVQCVYLITLISKNISDNFSRLLCVCGLCVGYSLCFKGCICPVDPWFCAFWLSLLAHCILWVLIFVYHVFYSSSFSSSSSSSSYFSPAPVMDLPFFPYPFFHLPRLPWLPRTYHMKDG